MHTGYPVVIACRRHVLKSTFLSEGAAGSKTLLWLMACTVPCSMDDGMSMLDALDTGVRKQLVGWHT